jgi:hypothetical protein
MDVSHGPLIGGLPDCFLPLRPPPPLTYASMRPRSSSLVLRKKTKKMAGVIAVFLNLWVMIPLGVKYQISCISGVYIMIHNSSKITGMK